MEKKRPIGITIISIVTIVINIVAMVLFLRPDTFNAIPTFQQDLLMSIFPFIGIFLNYYIYKAGVVFSLIFIGLGISLFVGKEIARKIFIFLQGLFLVIGIASLAFGLFWYSEMRSQGMSTLAIITGQLLPIIWRYLLFPIVFITYLTRPKVKEMFR